MSHELGSHAVLCEVLGVVAAGSGVAAGGGGGGVITACRHRVSGLLRNAAGWEVEPSIFGTAPAGFHELHPVPGPSSYQSVGRIPDGNDSDDNAVDFAVGIASLPGAPNTD